MWWRWTLGAALVAAVAWMILGRTPQPAAKAAVIEDKTYSVTPAAFTGFARQPDVCAERGRVSRHPVPA